MPGPPLSTRDEWMHLPPEVERLVPGLAAELVGRDEAVECERTESLLLDGSPERWLEYLRELGRDVESLADEPQPPAEADLARLAAILRDQLVLIQSVLDLTPDDFCLIRRLESLEAAGAGATPAQRTVT